MKKMNANLIQFITSPSLLILLLFLLLQTFDSDASQAYNCSPSACGLIPNISFPFRLKDDPKHCGYPEYELACENNVTMIDLNSQKFHVKAINYHNRTIRLGHVSIKINMTCSFPEYSVYAHNFNDPYGTESTPINFISCPYALKNSSLLTETRDCTPKGGRHTYIKVGHMKASDVKDMCRVDNTVLTSWNFKDPNNVSLSEIHESLLYGFELYWYPCRKCTGGWQCEYGNDVYPTCNSNGLPNTLSMVWEYIRFTLYSQFSDGHGPSAATILLIILLILGLLFIYALLPPLNSQSLFLSLERMLQVYVSNSNVVEDIAVVLFAGVSLPGMIIIAIICATTFFLIELFRGYTDTYWIFFLLRLLILLPCMLWILIYKFRRRHLSWFDAIEDFLQSDNKLMPIRYSYSDIKRMTRGFREKLGQGGYGSVYKGKLRSGHYVAVKLLGKTGGNDQDFMNEISTIGRIHHFNVVKLVGFCAQGSKRALVFDFMPNGSLEKYIFNRGNMNSLSWDKKYEIAVGVARGIEYLHRGCDIQILHFDIKPHNILLDDNFIPKISDFGLAKVCSTDKKTVTLTAVRGTIGYVAPELINRGIGGVSYKADVYSFGMLLIEMVGLNRDLTKNVASSSKYFPCWIYDCFDQGKHIESWKVIDDQNEDDGNNDDRMKIARKMTIIALWCIQMSPDARPSMNKVLEMFGVELEFLQIPLRPSQTPQVAVNVDSSWTSTCSLLPRDAAPGIEITVEMN